MSVSKQGRSSRTARLTGEHAGAWGTSSQDFVRIATLLYTESATHAKSTDGNCAPYVLAGIPMLLSALRCFLIELHSGLFTGERSSAALKDLSGMSNDVEVLRNNERLPSELLDDLDLLVQVRHEILHPAHRPGPDTDGTPLYLRRLKVDGFLQGTGAATDFGWLSQLQSHRLFRWAFMTTATTIETLMLNHGVPEYIVSGIRESYHRFEKHDHPT